MLRWIRILSAVCFLCALGCSSMPEPEGYQAPPAPRIGKSAHALSSPIDFTADTRSPSVVDNSSVTVTNDAGVGLPGEVDDEDAAVCWVTYVRGAFRGDNEYARIVTNGSGVYGVTVRSNTLFDGATGAGPAMAVRCRRMTDYMDVSQVPNFSTTPRSVTWNAVGCSTSTRTATTTITSGDLWPWSGGGGHFGAVAPVSWNASFANRPIGKLHISLNCDCPFAFDAYCSMGAFAYQTTWTSHSWAYSVTNAFANDTDSVVLTNDNPSNHECFVDGIMGNWKSDSSAKVEISNQDNKWRLITTKGTGSTGIRAFASCIPFSQNF